jgi:hypothetical protein
LSEIILGDEPSPPDEPPPATEPFGLAVVRWYARFVWATAALQVVPGMGVFVYGMVAIGALAACLTASGLALYVVVMINHGGEGTPEDRAALWRLVRRLWLALVIVIALFVLLRGKAAFESPPPEVPASQAAERNTDAVDYAPEPFFSAERKPGDTISTSLLVLAFGLVSFPDRATPEFCCDCGRVLLQSYPDFFDMPR